MNLLINTNAIRKIRRIPRITVARTPFPLSYVKSFLKKKIRIVPIIPEHPQMKKLTERVDIKQKNNRTPIQKSFHTLWSSLEGCEISWIGKSSSFFFNFLWSSLSSSFVEGEDRKEKIKRVPSIIEEQDSSSIQIRLNTKGVRKQRINTILFTRGGIEERNESIKSLKSHQSISSNSSIDIKKNIKRG